MGHYHLQSLPSFGKPHIGPQLSTKHRRGLDYCYQPPSFPVVPHDLESFYLNPLKPLATQATCPNLPCTNATTFYNEGIAVYYGTFLVSDLSFQRGPYFCYKSLVSPYMVSCRPQTPLVYQPLSVNHPSILSLVTKQTLLALPSWHSQSYHLPCGAQLRHPILLYLSRPPHLRRMDSYFPNHR
jgi:hypothetical protein